MIAFLSFDQSALNVSCRVLWRHVACWNILILLTDATAITTVCGPVVVVSKKRRKEKYEILVLHEMRWLKGGRGHSTYRFQKRLGFPPHYCTVVGSFQHMCSQLSPTPSAIIYDEFKKASKQIPTPNT